MSVASSLSGGYDIVFSYRRPLLLGNMPSPQALFHAPNMRAATEDGGGARQKSYPVGSSCVRTTNDEANHNKLPAPC